MPRRTPPLDTTSDDRALDPAHEFRLRSLNHSSVKAVGTPVKCAQIPGSLTPPSDLELVLNATARKINNRGRAATATARWTLTLSRG